MFIKSKMSLSREEIRLMNKASKRRKRGAKILEIGMIRINEFMMMEKRKKSLV